MDRKVCCDYPWIPAGPQVHPHLLTALQDSHHKEGPSFGVRFPLGPDSSYSPSSPCGRCLVPLPLNGVSRADWHRLSGKQFMITAKVWMLLLPFKSVLPYAEFARMKWPEVQIAINKDIHWRIIYNNSSKSPKCPAIGKWLRRPCYSYIIKYD
jgi:hypothetical protein